MSREVIEQGRRVVVKVGTSLLAPPTGGVHTRRFAEIARGVNGAIQAGRQILLVSSGAVGLGAQRLDWRMPLPTIPAKQAAAAVGQIHLCRHYERAFARHGRIVAQILLTHGGLSDRHRFLNARHTLQNLLESQVIPIINENDSVATEELRFGDNDQLAAQVVNVASADLLVLLTDVDGVLDFSAGRRRIPEIPAVTPALLAEMPGGQGPMGSGGMRSKLEAARAAGRYAVPTVIADGRRRDVLTRILAGEDVGTLVHCSPQRLSSRKYWIAFSLRPRGQIRIDAGAVRALRKQGRSLVPSGVTGVEGRFGPGDLVGCVSEGGDEVARGLSAYSSKELTEIKGQQTIRISEILGYSNGDEVIHRDDLVLL
jgi:glutamate 5-kinase